MRERTLRVLEFTKIREQLSTYSVTDMGRELCLSLTPFTNLSQVTEALEITEEAQVILTYMGGSPLISFSDVRAYLTLADKGATLNPHALLDVAECLRAARAARTALVTERENTPRITALASRLQTFRNLEDSITTAIISEEEIADRASPALFDIRRHIKQANERIREKLSSMAHGSTFSKYLQESIVTVRNGRYVLPVKQEYRQFVPGLVHDQSSTGATLFVEPMAVVELGNDLKQWTSKEREEIQRILAELSAQVGAQQELIAENINILTSLDFIFAKGHLSREMRAVMPKINDQGRIRLVRVRHPLIPRETVVPCDLWMGEDFTTLIITGPNTGGKTVTLKTVGLLTLMAQSGLHVPGNLGTELSVFEQVYADIGDEQSIEQSLSTFSSHMKNIVEIVSEVTDRDLVLFDELGAGTDPTEGAALAQTILHTLLQSKVRTVATTHYSELKAYALSTPGVENASVEFDVSTLRPTYRLSIGVPGKSNAFEISSRLGLPEYIIDGAKKLLSANDVRFEDVIAGAEYQRQIAQREREAAESARAETIRLRNEAEKLYREMEEKRQNIERKAKEDGRRIVENARREAENVILELKKMKKEGAAGREAEVNALRKKMQSSIDGLSEGLMAKNPTLTPPPKDLKSGDTVEIIHLNTQGTVLSAPDAKGNVQVQAGIMKMNVNITQLRLISQKKTQQKKSSVHVHSQSQSRTVRMECDVRGMALDEALMEVERYLDEAVMAGMNEVSIVHGKGTGILRQGIQRHLKTYPHVKSYRSGVYGEGEMGVTIVTLK
ncbi:MAG: endonuclease MutS2 [Clostridia bacterium]|nr:endonuclease MutS2 [Clostridia bacterium]